MFYLEELREATKIEAVSEGACSVYERFDKAVDTL